MGGLPRHVQVPKTKRGKRNRLRRLDRILGNLMMKVVDRRRWFEKDEERRYIRECLKAQAWDSKDSVE